MSEGMQEEIGFADFLEQARDKKLYVIGHLRPDGDCIGSQVALAKVLQDQGLDVSAFNADPVPHNLEFLLGDIEFEHSHHGLDQNALLVSVDCSDDLRMGEPFNQKPYFLSIDHHLSHTSYAQFNVVNRSASSTAEVLIDWFDGANIAIDAQVAQALYVGIATDTVHFKSSTTDSSVFQRCARLCQLGANPQEAAFALYSQNPKRKWDLLSGFLSTLHLVAQDRAAIGIVNADLKEAVQAQPEDLEGFVNYALNVEGVQIGILLEQVQLGKLKGSLRAHHPDLRVDLLAQQFGGGGHSCAAGFRVDEDIDRFYGPFCTRLEAHLAQHRRLDAYPL